MLHHLLFLLSPLSAIKYKGRSVLKIVFFLIFVFCAVRYEFGNDYESYEHNFLDIKLGSMLYGVQFGFYYLNYLSPNFITLIIISSLIWIIALYHLIIRNLSSNEYWMALIILFINPYIFFMSLSAIRQTLALSIFIFSIKYIIERKIILYTLLIFSASLFHSSAIVLLPLYYLVNTKPIKCYSLILFLFIVVLLFLNGSIIISIISYVLDLIGAHKFIFYIENLENNSLRSGMLSFIYLVYVLININKLDDTILLLAKLYLLGLSFAVLSVHISMLSRLQMYFDVFSIIVITKIVTTNLKECKRTLLGAINKYILPILILIIYVLRYYSFFNTSMWLPFQEYKTIFSVYF